MLILFGGYQMLERRSYPWAMAAGIISIVACSLIGLPIGIWALIVLAREDVKASFGPGAPALPPALQTGRFWRRFALVAGCVVLILLALAVIVTLASVIVPAWGQAVTRSREVQAGISQDAGGEFHKENTQTFPLNADGVFRLDNINGRIEIHGWSSNAVVLHTSIHGKTGESVEAVSIGIESDPGHVRVHTEQPSNVTGFPWSWLWFKNAARNDASVEYTVQAPRGARLENISSVNGNILIDGVSGDITASAVNGDTQVEGAAGNLKLSTVNGSIVADMAVLGAGQSVSLDSANGAIELALPENADAHFSVNTLNGSFSSEFPSLQPEKKDPPSGPDLSGSLGNGSAAVKATGVNATIKIRKS